MEVFTSLHWDSRTGLHRAKNLHSETGILSSYAAWAKEVLDLRTQTVSIVRLTVAGMMLMTAGCPRGTAPTIPLPGPPPTSPVDCGNRSNFDTDGDGISDPIERNNGENNYADLLIGRCDDDPSRPVGPPNDGNLLGGLNLPDRGIGYAHFRGSDGVDQDDWGTLQMLDCLESVGRATEGMGIQIGIGDISLRRGGAFPPHSSHQNGLDADLRYVRKDRDNVPLDLRFQADEYDAQATKVVFEAFFLLCPVEVIFVDIDRLGFALSGREGQLVHVNGHSNHFHVRVGGS